MSEPRFGVWQPIETAPKDGRKLIFFTIHEDIEVAEYYRSEFDVYDLVGDDLYRKRTEVYADNWNTTCRPTHWMPLPEPPAVPVASSPAAQGATD